MEWQYLKSGGKNSAREGCIGMVHDILYDNKKRLDMKFTTIRRMCTEDLVHHDIVISHREQDPITPCLLHLVTPSP